MQLSQQKDLVEFGYESIVSAIDSLNQLEFVETNKKPGVPPLCKVKDKSLSEIVAKCLGLFHTDLIDSQNGLNLSKPQKIAQAKSSRDQLIRSLHQKSFE